MGLIYKKEACFNTLFSYCLAWSNDLLILDLSYLKVRLRIPIGNSLVKEKGTASSMATWQKKNEKLRNGKQIKPQHKLHKIEKYKT